MMKKSYRDLTILLIYTITFTAVKSQSPHLHFSFVTDKDIPDQNILLFQLIPCYMSTRE